jgi:serine/threonine-protein kinase RsbW
MRGVTLRWKGARFMSRSLAERLEYVHRWWPADARRLRAIRRALRGWLGTCALSDDRIDDVVLAVDEAVANAVEHAYGPGETGTVELVLWTEPSSLNIEVIDHGTWRPPPTDDAFRGRGIQLMHHLIDSVAIHFDARGTRVLMRHEMPAHRKETERSEHRTAPSQMQDPPGLAGLGKPVDPAARDDSPIPLQRTADDST